jgi:ethanolamine ammonia-lyase small subunit
LHQAIGREAVLAELNFDELRAVADFRVLATMAATKEEHLASPEQGSRLNAAGLARLKHENNQVQVVVSGGLSAPAVAHNVPALMGVLDDAFKARGTRVGQPMLVRYGRVKLAEQIAEAVRAELIVYLIGERPGGDAQAARSLSAYLVYRRQDPGTQVGSDAGEFVRASYEYSVVSNIHELGLPPLEAGAVIAEKVFLILALGAGGNRLEGLLARQARRGAAGPQSGGDAPSG